MLLKIKKAVLLTTVFTISANANAQNVTPPQTTEPAVKVELVEIKTNDGQTFLVEKQNLIVKPEVNIAPEIKTETTETTTTTTTETNVDNSTQNDIKKNEYKNIQINVDAKKYYNNSNNTTTENKTENVTVENKVIEIKDNTDSVIKTDASNTSAVQQETSTDVSTKTEVVAEPTDVRFGEKKETPAPVVVEKKEVVIENKTKTEIKSSTTPLLVPDPAVTEDGTLAQPEIEIVAPTTPTKTITTTVSANELKPKRFSVKGGFGIGNYTTISDISSNYSFGIGVAYDINHLWNIEVQYVMSEFEDSYDYGYYGGYGLDSKFSQNDLSVIANYKVITTKPVTFMLRGGLNWSYRTAEESYAGYTDSSNALLAILGLGVDVRVASNVFITGIFDYNLSLSDSGYDYYGNSPLDLVAGESYTNFNIGVKFKF